ncbi:MAG: hypothetical protein JOZ29_12275 [Deltaproteobacteria bacterium]|nr:hypothetical protein [Deltaproteobacteria bacterium]
MSLKQGEFREQFSYQEPILPDSLDNATAFFYAVNQLIRSTPSEISGTLEFTRPGPATWFLDHLGIRIRDLALTAARWIRRAGAVAPSTWKG